MRKEFKLTDKQYDALLEVCRPVPMIALHCGPILSNQKRVNTAWEALGQEIGFDPMTVQPVDGKNEKHFSAEVLAPQHNLVEVGCGNCDSKVMVRYGLTPEEVDGWTFNKLMGWRCPTCNKASGG